MRSLSGRLQIFLDAYSTEEGGGDGDKILTEAPPRRVFYALISVPTIWFSDYLFRGESDETVRQSAKDIMDLDLDVANIFSDIETADGE